MKGRPSASGKAQARRRGRGGRLIDGISRGLAKLAVNTIGKGADFIGDGLDDHGIGLFKRIGRAIKFLAGTETLSQTSIEFGLSTGMGLPSWLRILGGIGLSTSTWSGSLKYWDEVIAGKRPRDIHLNYGMGLGTPVWGVTLSRMGKVSSWSLPYVDAFFGPRSHGVAFAIDNVGGFALGNATAAKPGETARGPFLGFGMSVPVLPFVYVGFSFTLYYPPLALLTEKLRPLAERMHKIMEKVSSIGRKIRRLLGGRDKDATVAGGAPDEEAVEGGYPTTKRSGKAGAASRPGASDVELLGTILPGPYLSPLTNRPGEMAETRSAETQSKEFSSGLDEATSEPTAASKNRPENTRRGRSRVNDHDRDGIDDERDRCMGAREDFDGVEDDDGCPEGRDGAVGPRPRQSRTIPELLDVVAGDDVGQDRVHLFHKMPFELAAVPWLSVSPVVPVATQR